MAIGNYRLPKICLLRKKQEFDRVYNQGRRVHGKGFSLIYTDGPADWNRLGISIRKKTGGAVERNRIKRIIREAFRLHRESFPKKSDIVVTVRPGFSLRSPSEVLSAVVNLLRTGSRAA